MVKKLYNAYLKEPDLIHCHRVTKFERNNGQWDVIAGGYDVYSKPTFLHKLTGGSGALYPINSLFGDITNADLFMTLAPSNDDIWFWLMAVLNAKKCNVLENGHPELYFTKGSQATALCNVNDNGEKLFWKQLNNIFEYYPQIEKILIDEWERVSNS